MPATVSKSGLNPRELYEFDLSGYIILKHVFSREQIDAMNKAIDLSQVTESRFKFPVLQIDPMFLDLLAHERFMGICRDLLGERFRFDHAFGVHQGPGADLAIENLHAGPGANQGSYFYHWYGGRPRCGMITFSIIMEPIRTGDGGLVLVPGSHKHNLPLAGGEVRDQILGGDMEAWWIHNPTVEPGDVLVFTEAVIHGTRRWLPTDRRRRIVFFKYSPGYMAWRDPSDELAGLASLARNDLEKRLLAGPSVASYDESLKPEWPSRWRPPTLLPLEYRISRMLGKELPSNHATGSKLALLMHVLRALPYQASRAARLVRKWSKDRPD